MNLKRRYIRWIAAIVILILPFILTVFAKSDYLQRTSNDLIVLFSKPVDNPTLTQIFKDFEDKIEIKKHFDDYVVVSVKSKRIYDDVYNYLGNHSLVKAVQPDGIVRIMKVSNDIYSQTQWAIQNPGYYMVYSTDGFKEVSAKTDIDMDVAEAWLHMDREKVKRRPVIVAIIDTGVDYNHPDLADNIWVNKNEIPDDGIDNDNNGYVDDIYGWDFYHNDASVCHYQYDKSTGLNLALPNDNDDHGTHVAGIIGAVKDNKIGIAGIASNIDIKIMILKINGGPQGTGSISDAILAVKYATMMGADICNISWGTDKYSPALEEVMKESGMLFVAAAGNVGSNNDKKPVYPANFKLDNLISVAYIDADGNLSKQSNYGRTTVDFAAPGDKIFSTVVGTYQTISGTSMAAPHVSAVASLLYSYDEYLYPQAVKNVLINTLKPINDLKKFMKYPGIPNAFQAVMTIDKTERDYLPPVISLETVYDKESLAVNVAAKDEGGSGLRVIRWLPGEKEITDFGHGSGGFKVENGQIKVAKAGTYTFYAADYAGNEIKNVYDVADDKTAPTISAGYAVSDDYKTRTVTVKVKDTQSGIKRVKYMEGNKKASDFMPAGAGKEIKIKDNKGTFKVKKDGYYTIYAIDYRGNQTVKLINVKTIKSEEIKFSVTEKMMAAGEKYVLKVSVKPVNSTDVITYASSDETVASVFDDGKVIALKEGTATITAKTSNGHIAECRITVVKKE